MSEKQRPYVVCAILQKSDREDTVQVGCALAVSKEEAVGMYVTSLLERHPGMHTHSAKAIDLPRGFIEEAAREYGVLPEAVALIRQLLEALAAAESEARRYAKAYPVASDARYALNMLADRIAGLANSEDDKGRSG